MHRSTLLTPPIGREGQAYGAICAGGRRSHRSALRSRGRCPEGPRGAWLMCAAKHDRRIHPGSGRRRGPDHPKGRQVDPAALAEVQALLGERERRRDLLIEHLHLAAGPFRLPLCASSRGTRRGDAAGTRRGLRGRLVLRPFRHRHGRRGAAAAADRAGVRQLELRAGRRRCSSSMSCAAGSAIAVRVVRAPCMGGCHRAPVVAIGHALHEHATSGQCRRCRRGRSRHIRRSPNLSASTPIARPAAIACSKRAWRASASPKS